MRAMAQEQILFDIPALKQREESEATTCRSKRVAGGRRKNCGSTDYAVQLNLFELFEPGKSAEPVDTATTVPQEDCENNGLAMSLEDVEQKLANILAKEMATWIDIFKLLDYSEKKKLFRRNHKSFTSWIRYFTEKIHIHESYIWRILRAGRILDRFYHGGIDVLSGKKINSFSIITVSKIANGDDNVMRELLQKTVDGEITGREIQRRYRKIKDDKRMLIEKEVYEKDRIKTSENNEEYRNSTYPTAKTIKDLLHNNKWFYRECSNKELDNRICVEKSLDEGFFVAMDEFPVITWEAKTARRIDVLFVESYSTKYDRVAVHGVEIKVSRNDLDHDEKMGDYADFVDYFWVAVPNDLVRKANYVIPEQYGVLSVAYFDLEARYIVEIHRYPHSLDPSMREETLDRFCARLLGRMKKA